MHIVKIIAFFAIIFSLGCSYTVQFSTEYAAQKGSGTISESESSQSTTEQTPTVDVTAELTE